MGRHKRLAPPFFLVFSYHNLIYEFGCLTPCKITIFGRQNYTPNEVFWF